MRVLIILHFLLFSDKLLANCKRDYEYLLISKNRVNVSGHTLKKLKAIHSFKLIRYDKLQEFEALIEMVSLKLGVKVEVLEQGAQVFIQDELFIVQSILGLGAEGILYVAKSRNGDIVTLKDFYYGFQALINVTELRQLSKVKASVIKLLAFDERKKVVALEYIYGISVKDILENEWNLLTPKELKLMKGYYQIFVETLSEESLNFIVKENVLFDLDDLKFIIIDPF